MADKWNALLVSEDHGLVGPTNHVWGPEHPEHYERVTVVRLERIKGALDLITQFGGIDGAHHKQWTLDQVVRQLCGSREEYDNWLREYCQGEDGPDTYLWDEGIAP